MCAKNNSFKRVFTFILLLIITLSVMFGCKSVQNNHSVKSSSQSVVSDDNVRDLPVNKNDLRFISTSTNDESSGYIVVSYDSVHYFYNEYLRLVEKYGEPKVEDGKLKGVAVVRFGDFVGTGRQQMYVAYADGTKDYVNKQAVYIFDNGPGELINKEGSSIKSDITSKDDGTPSIWIFKSSSKAYLVTGDDMSKAPVYHEYITKTESAESVYAFQETTKETDGSYVKINLTGLSADEANRILDVTKENVKIMQELYSKETYIIEQ